MSSSALDTLTLARRLEREADFPQAQAEATATILADTVDEAAVTRAHFDLKMMELEARFVGIDARFVKLEAKFDQRFTEIETRISENETKTEAGFAKTEAGFVKTEADFARIEAKISETETRLKYDMTLRFGAMIAASVAILAGLMKIMLHSLPLAP